MGRYGDAVDRVSTSDFYKMQDGDNRLRFLSDPVAQNKTFENNPEPQTIFSWYVWDYANKKVAILSKGAGFLRNVDAMMDEWGEELPMKCDVNIKKSGVGLATKYTWVASPAKTGKDAVPDNWSDNLKPLLEAVPHSIDISAFGSGDDPATDMGDLGDDDPFAGIDTVAPEN